MDTGQCGRANAVGSPSVFPGLGLLLALALALASPGATCGVPGQGSQELTPGLWRQRLRGPACSRALGAQTTFLPTVGQCLSELTQRNTN